MKDKVEAGKQIGGEYGRRSRDAGAASSTGHAFGLEGTKAEGSAGNRKFGLVQRGVYQSDTERLVQCKWC